MFTGRPDLNFNLVRFQELHGYDHITIKNVSSIPAEWSLKECPECIEVQTNQKSTLLKEGDT